jgi:hypothetical protein
VRGWARGREAPARRGRGSPGGRPRPRSRGTRSRRRRRGGDVDGDVVRAASQEQAREDLLARIFPVAVAIQVDPGIEAAFAVGDHQEANSRPLAERIDGRDAVLVVEGEVVVAGGAVRSGHRDLRVDERAEVEAGEDPVGRAERRRERRVGRIGSVPDVQRIAGRRILERGAGREFGCFARQVIGECCAAPPR